MLRACLRLSVVCLLAAALLTTAGVLTGRALPDTRQFVQSAIQYLPDGEGILWLTFHDASRHVWLTHRVPYSMPWSDLPAWSPDGERLSWSATRLDKVDYHMLQLPRGGGIRHRRYASMGYARVITNGALSLSPTARHFVVPVPDDISGVRMAIGTTGGDDPPLHIDDPPGAPFIGNLRVWSADGRWLAYLQPSLDGDPSRLIVIDVFDGSATVFPLPDLKGALYPPAWSPVRPYQWTPHGLVYEVHQPFDDTLLASSLPVSLRLYDPRLRTHRPLIDTPPGARFLEPLAVSPSGRRLIVAARRAYRLGWHIEAGDSLHVIDLASGAARLLWSHGKPRAFSHGMLLPNDRTLLLFSGTPSDLVVAHIDLLSGKQSLYQTGAGWSFAGAHPHGDDQARVLLLHHDPDAMRGDFVLWNPHTDDAHRVDADGGGVVNVFTPPAGAHSLILTVAAPGPASAAPPVIAPATASNPNTFYGVGGFQTPEYRLYVADDMGRSPRLIYRGGMVTGLSWSDDGRALTLSVSDQGEFYQWVTDDVLDPDAPLRRFTPAVPGSLTPPRWRPPAPG